MGLIRKALFFGTAATGMPLVRGRSSAEAAAIEQRQLLEQQNSILSDLAKSQRRAQRLSGTSEQVASHAPSSTPAAEPSLTDRLTEIKRLLERGLITEEEFSAMRKNALGL
jgi:hypothetical protein